MTEKTADTPCTAAGRADHDLAWDSDNRKAEQAIGNHQWEREGCAACTGIARIEAEAATPSEPEAVRLLDPRLIRSIILSTGGTMDYANTVVQRLAREGYTTPPPATSSVAAVLAVAAAAADSTPAAANAFASLDVERLRLALASVLGEDDVLADGSLWKISEIAWNVAPEYARLADKFAPPAGEER